MILYGLMIFSTLDSHGHDFVYTRCIKMNVKQSSAIKFCVHTGKYRKETMEMLVKAYGDAAIKRSALHK